MRWDFVTGWLAKAEEDLASARLILRGTLRSFENSSFHAQQAVEKALKAVLVRYQINFPRSHDIGELLGLVEPHAPGITADLAAARSLTVYAVSARYPGSEPVSRPDAQHHVDVADRVVEYLRQHLASYLDAGRPSS